MTRTADQSELVRRMHRDYESGMAYKRSLNLLDTVEMNERFYLGDQWHGLKSRQLRPIVLNVLRRAVTFFQATIVSDDIGVELRPPMASEEQTLFCRAAEQEIERVIERADLKARGREVLRDGAVDGDGILYLWFDPDEESGQAVSGEIRAECLMNTNVILGNPYSSDIQRQPWIMIVRRRAVSDVRREAEKLGVDPRAIRPESNSEFVNEEHAEDGSLCTELIRFWREDGKNGAKRMRVLRVCGETVLQTIENEQSLYPIAWFTWEPRKNCCHGVSPITEAIPSQIAINQMWTAINTFTHRVAFPKIVYNKSKFPQGWDGNPDKAVAVNGDPKDSLVNMIGGAQLPAGVLNVLNSLIDRTMELMGVTDAALGNVRPENTSAIVAVQNATAAPLYLQRLRFYSYWEQVVRILVDLMRCYYGQRAVLMEDKEADPLTGGEREVQKSVLVDFGALGRFARDLTVEVGETSYWSRIIQIATADNLLRAGFYTDNVDYLEAIPDGLIRNKADLIQKMRERGQTANMQQQAAPQGGAADINLAAALG